MIIDTFPINDEMDMLFCRLTEMADHVDYVIAIEADVDHQNNPKPYHLTDNIDRFAQWADKLIVIQAKDLPTTPHDQDPWAREWAQRDWVWNGLEQINAQPSDVVLHGDVDEICRPLHIRNVRPRFKEFVQFAQSLHCFAVDWLHPDPWGGTVACTVETARAIGERKYVGDEMYHPGAWQIVRNQRNGIQARNFEGVGYGWKATVLPEAGWHLSWIGGHDAAQRKLGSFCHPEIADRVASGLASDLFLRDGWHVDGRKQLPVDVDETFPHWIVEGHAPESWFRPR